MEQYEHYCHFYKVPSESMVTFLTFIGQNLYDRIKDMLAPTDPRQLKYEVFPSRLIAHFTTQTNVIVERYKFHALRQNFN